jgi:hypothetical protein
MPIAFTSADGPSTARVELSTPQATKTAVMLPVPLLVPRQEALGLDGSVPVPLVLLAAGHARGMYNWQQYIQVIADAAAQMDATLSYRDELAVQTEIFTQNLGSIARFSPPVFTFFSDGSTAITVGLTFGGATGAPLLLDYITSINQTG